MKLRIVTSLVTLLLSVSLLAQNYTVSGTITDVEGGKPVEFATVVLQSSEQWAVANAKGEFTINIYYKSKDGDKRICLYSYSFCCK